MPRLSYGFCLGNVIAALLCHVCACDASEQPGLVLIQRNVTRGNGPLFAYKVDLDEKGYKAIAALKDNGETAVFMRRVLTTFGLQVRDEDEFRQRVPLYNGKRHKKSFNELVQEIQAAHWAAWGPVSNDTNGPAVTMLDNQSSVLPLKDANAHHAKHIPAAGVVSKEVAEYNAAVNHTGSVPSPFASIGRAARNSTVNYTHDPTHVILHPKGFVPTGRDSNSVVDGKKPMPRSYPNRTNHQDLHQYTLPISESLVPAKHNKKDLAETLWEKQLSESLFGEQENLNRTDDQGNKTASSEGFMATLHHKKIHHKKIHHHKKSLAENVPRPLEEVAAVFDEINEVTHRVGKTKRHKKKRGLGHHKKSHLKKHHSKRHHSKKGHSKKHRN